MRVARSGAWAMGVTGHGTQQRMENGEWRMENGETETGAVGSTVRRKWFEQRDIEDKQQSNALVLLDNKSDTATMWLAEHLY